MTFEQVYQKAVNQSVAQIRLRIEPPLKNLQLCDPAHSPNTVYNGLAELSQHQETLCGDLRYALRALHSGYEAQGLLPLYVPLIQAPEVHISITSGMVRITMDALLPYPTKGSVFYLHGKLDAALELYVAERTIPRPIFQERCAVVFLHHYDMEMSCNRKLRDYDNLERRCILNVLTRHIFVDDAPRNLISMDAMAAGQRDFTEICVMPVSRFASYILSPDLLGKYTE